MLSGLDKNASLSKTDCDILISDLRAAELVRYILHGDSCTLLTQSELKDLSSRLGLSDSQASVGDPAALHISRTIANTPRVVVDTPYTLTFPSQKLLYMELSQKFNSNPFLLVNRVLNSTRTARVSVRAFGSYYNISLFEINRQSVKEALSHV